MEAPPPPSQPLARSLLARAIPIALMGGLAATNAWTYTKGQQELAGTRAERDALDVKVREASEVARKTNEALAAETRDLALAREALAKAEERIRDAGAKGTSEVNAALAEKADALKRIALLTDRLGESEAARKTAEAHAKELDELMELCRKHKVNVRRQVGLDAPPHVELEVVETVDRRVPPVLVLRATGTLDGFEEGDRLYLTRLVEGRPHETGQAVLEKIDRANRLLSARVARLDTNEHVSVGDRLQTYPPP